MLLFTIKQNEGLFTLSSPKIDKKHNKSMQS